MNAAEIKSPAPGNTIVIFMAVLVISVFSLFPSNSSAASLDTLRISLIDGDVQIKTEDLTDWAPAAINTPLREGDSVWVPSGGKAELHLKDGTYLRLNQNSSLEILTLDNDSFQFYLTTGQLYVNFRGLKDNVIQIDTSVSSTRAYDRASFRIDQSETETGVSVYKGTVHSENKHEKIKVDARSALLFKGPDRTELSSLGPVDAWEKWNKERDGKLYDQAAGPRMEKESAKYLPEELGTYSSDFAANGRWVRTNDYGAVWTPTVVVADWAPYRVGRWVWMGGDYVWISYEPWGWAPYHYGRWVFISSIGWSWIPPARGAVYWGPGFVGWVQTPTAVAWVPLAPGEIYYGRGYYGPGSVNITNINIVNVHKTTKIVYKNVKVRNAVTTVRHDTFVKGRDGHARVKENPFLKEKVRLGSPDIKPEKTTLMPTIKEVSHAKQPPKAVRDIKAKELKVTRPLVKDKTVPVIKPEPVKKTMPDKKTGEQKLPAEKQIEQAPVQQKQPQPAEKYEKAVEKEIRKEGEPKDILKKQPEQPIKTKEPGLTPEEKQKLRRKFDKQRKTDEDVTAPQKGEREQRKEGAVQKEKQQSRQRPEKQRRLEDDIAEPRKDLKEPAREPQKPHKQKVKRGKTDEDRKEDKK